MSNQPAITFKDQGDYRIMSSANDTVVMGLMNLQRPNDLVGEYPIAMMAGLLFGSVVDYPRMHAMQLGLGPGSLTKYCWARLGMQVTAVELDPAVVSACRDQFGLPPNGERLRVVLADAADEIARPQYRKSVDLLHVDVYDSQSLRPALDDIGFWTDCRNALTEQGCMTVNLWGADPAYCVYDSVARISSVFGRESIWLLHLNTAPNIVLVARRSPMPADPLDLMQQACVVHLLNGVPAHRFLMQLACPL